MKDTQLTRVSRYEQKKRHKMVKAKKHWVVIGLLFGGLALGSVSQAHTVSADVWTANTVESIQQRLTETSKEFVMERGDTIWNLGLALNVKNPMTLLYDNGFSDGEQYTIAVGTRITVDGSRITVTDPDGNIIGDKVVTDTEKIETDKTIAGQKSDTPSKPVTTDKDGYVKEETATKPNATTPDNVEQNKPSTKPNVTAPGGVGQTKPSTDAGDNTPEKPSTPTPDKPAPEQPKPETPVAPTPDEPSQPETPVAPTPDEPSQPETPSEPETPETPTVNDNLLTGVPETQVPGNLPNNTASLNALLDALVKEDAAIDAKLNELRSWVTSNADINAKYEQAIQAHETSKGLLATLSSFDGQTIPSVDQHIESYPELSSILEQAYVGRDAIANINTQYGVLSEKQAIVASIQAVIDQLSTEMATIEQRTIDLQTQLEALELNPDADDYQEQLETLTYEIGLSKVNYLQKSAVRDEQASLKATASAEVDAQQAIINGAKSEVENAKAAYAQQLQSLDTRIAQEWAAVEALTQSKERFDTVQKAIDALVARKQTIVTHKQNIQVKLDQIKELEEAKKALTAARNAAISEIESIGSWNEASKAVQKETIATIKNATTIDAVNAAVTQYKNLHAENTSLVNARKAAQSKLNGMAIANKKPYSDRLNSATSIAGIEQIMKDAKAQEDKEIQDQNNKKDQAARVSQLLSAKINQERKSVGLKSLGVDVFASAATDVRAAEITTKFSHTRPNGSDFDTALVEQDKIQTSQSNVKPENRVSWGENLVWADMGMPSSDEEVAQYLFELWVNSPGHYSNMTDPDYTHYGLSVTQVGNKFYAAQIFTQYI